LDLIHRTLEPAVLATYDNKMVVEHRCLMNGYGTTLAVVDKDAAPDQLTLEQYWRDVIHRHAHRFASQPEGSLFKYRQNQRTPIR
jgi:hypothetical protein